MRIEDLPPGTQTDLMTTHGVMQRKKSKSQTATERLSFELRSHRLSGWTPEYRFAGDEFFTEKGRPRQWRFDFAHPELKLAVEIEGLVVRMIAGQRVCTGRHATVDGFREDCRKYAAATELGWQILRFEQSMVMNGEAIDTIERVLARRGWQRK